MDDLAQWLRAQLDADEKVVRDGLCVNCENPTAPLVSPLGVTGYTHEGGWEGRRCPGRLVGAERVQNPARVLREIDAKRKLVKLHGRATLRAGGGAQYFDTTTVCRSCEANLQFPEESWPCSTLRLLAAPYSDRPGFREEWAP